MKKLPDSLKLAFVVIANSLLLFVGGWLVWIFVSHFKEGSLATLMSFLSFDIKFILNWNLYWLFGVLLCTLSFLSIKWYFFRIPKEGRDMGFYLAVFGLILLILISLIPAVSGMLYSMFCEFYGFSCSIEYLEKLSSSSWLVPDLYGY